MTVEINFSASPDPSSTSQVVDDLKSTIQSVQNKDWQTGDFGGAGAGLQALGSVSDPLSALAGAGFGFLAESVSFLSEPLQQLAGDPSSISSGAEGFQNAGRAVSTIASEYGQSTGPQTSGWSGEAAAGYLKTGAELVDGINGLGQAGVALAEAAAGAGEAVAKTLQEVTTLVNEAVGKIIMIMNQAIAAAQATFGASIAAAIPQAVQVAVEYGGRIMGHLQTLLSSAQNLMKHVDSTAKAVASLTGKIVQISELAQQSTGSPRGTTAQSAQSGGGVPGLPSDQSSIPASSYSGSAHGTTSAGATSAPRLAAAGYATANPVGSNPGSPGSAYSAAAGAASQSGSPYLAAGSPMARPANSSEAETTRKNPYEATWPDPDSAEAPQYGTAQYGAPPPNA
ncbi:hypothetical protein AB0L88_13115 [Saccharopolyspora shandongensis]|uniref:Proteins of 100 residues with WXG n=1 Tax=Saccharopolyspora shandongensis TaxID=418495 RepID=A0A1H3KZB7_9PSEU|nr:hypothetical protein [Saccharopolyspora shandongensis]SDY57511.1 hypothetical protein SAMN05216215_102991 [Saccharopolyspora shandongensis]